MPNLFAYGMILLWPFIAILLYKKLDTVTATFWTIVGGYMLLPVGTAIDLPMIPAIGKDEISAIAALIGCVVIKHEKIAFFGTNNVQKTLIGLLLFIPILNVFFNSEPMFNGELWIQGLTLYDAVAQVLAQYLELLPFIIAISIVKNLEDLTKVTRLLVVAGLVYSIPVLFEIRISPQLHTWVYGFFPHSFAQQARFGGFRAVVFMGHGLLVATFLFVCVCAAAIQVKIGTPREKTRNIFIFGYLFLVLIASKSVGAIILGALLSLSVLFLFTSMQKIIVKTIVAVFLLYPTLSILGLVPYEGIVAFINNFNTDKAGSIDFRFTHEKALLAHAYEKVLIGWGSWGRNRLADSVTDGYWLIVYGKYGAVYFYALFGLFILPAVSRLNGATITLKERALYVGFSLILAGVVFDQIPNASLGSSWLWYLGGCLSACTANNRLNKLHDYSIEKAS
jgi:hypothetical protein